MNPNLSGYRRFYFTALDYFASLPFQVRAGSIQLSFGPGESLTTGLGMSRKKRGSQGLVVAGFWWSERRSWGAKASPTQKGVSLRDCHVAALLAMTRGRVSGSDTREHGPRRVVIKWFFVEVSFCETRLIKGPINRTATILGFFTSLIDQIGGNG